MMVVTVVPNSGVGLGMLAMFDPDKNLYYVGYRKYAPMPLNGATVVVHPDEVLDYERSLE